MADEQSPPKRDVNELFTLDASESTPNVEGPLAHLMSTSPVADDTRLWTEPGIDGDEGHVTTGRRIGEVAAAQPGEVLPSVADVAGLEDLYEKKDVRGNTGRGDTGRDTAGRHRSGPPTRPVRIVESPESPDTVEPFPAPAGMPRTPILEHFNPTETQPVDHHGVRRPRRIEIGGDLQFSTEAGPRSVPSWSESENGLAYSTALAQNVVPAPVAPNRSVRVPGQQRRSFALPAILVDMTERRWFWGAAAALVGLTMVVLLAAGDLASNPLTGGRPDVVADSSLATVPAADDGGLTDTSAGNDNSSSTGVGSGAGAWEPDSTSTDSVVGTSAPPATTSSGRRTTTAQTSVRSTTTDAPGTTRSTTTTAPSTTATVDSSSTTDTTASSTTDPDATSSTDPTSSTETTDPDDTATTEDTSGDSTTTTDHGGGSTSSPDDPPDP